MSGDGLDYFSPAPGRPVGAPFAPPAARPPFPGSYPAATGHTAAGPRGRLVTVGLAVVVALGGMAVRQGWIPFGSSATVELPPVVAGLERLVDGDVAALEAQMSTMIGDAGGEDVEAPLVGVYGSRGRPSLLLIAGAQELSADDRRDLVAGFEGGMRRTVAGIVLSPVPGVDRDVDAGCGSVAAQRMTACYFADDESYVVTTVIGRTPADAEALSKTVRAQVVTRG